MLNEEEMARARARAEGDSEGGLDRLPIDPTYPTSTSPIKAHIPHNIVLLIEDAI